MANETVKIPYRGELCDGTEIKVLDQDEHPNTYELADGTRMTLKTVMMSVIRLNDRFNKTGEPVYVLKSQNVLTTNVIDEGLWKKEDKG